MEPRRYKLELDLIVRFSPMSDHARGIVFTREIELPFPPSSKLFLFSKEFDECPYPPGMCIKDVAWDLDREVFLAKTEISYGSSVAEIPMILAGWRERGWKLGSYEDRYHADDSDDDADGPNAEAGEAVNAAALDLDELERLERVSPRKRPRELNEVVKAVVRCLVDTYDDEAVAYAIDRTGFVYCAKTAEFSKDDDAAREWRAAYDAFSKMAEDKRELWRNRVKRYRNILKLEPLDARY